MWPDPAVLSSPAPPSSMGRKRTRDFNLPPHMQRKGSAYYFVSSSKPRRWVALGSDLAAAKRKWADLDAGTPQGLTVGELVARYIDRTERAAGTMLQYRSYQKALADAFPIPAAQLTSVHVALWQEINGHRKAYADGCVGLLKATCRLGKRLGLSDTIDAEKWIPGGSRRDRVLSAGEFRAIRSQAPEWLQVAMDLGYLTSARPSDLRSLRWAQVGPEAIVWRHQKTGTRQEVVLNDDLASVLARARQRPILGLYVVATAKGRPATRNQMDYAWHQACLAAGVEDAQFRDIRAMAARAKKDEGGDFQALLGHTTRAMSERYIKGRQVVKAEPVRRKL